MTTIQIIWLIYLTGVLISFIWLWVLNNDLKSTSIRKILWTILSLFSWVMVLILLIIEVENYFATKR